MTPDYRIRVARPTNFYAFIERMRKMGLELRQTRDGELFIQPTKERQHARIAQIKEAVSGAPVTSERPGGLYAAVHPEGRDVHAGSPKD